KVGHVEAGLRSYDKEMPEEINRVLTDHLSDHLFAPTENSKQNLLREGIDEEKIVVTGNTVVDAIYQNSKLYEGNNVLEELDLKEDDYFLVTVHRQENVDNKEKFRGILKGLESIREEFEKPVIYPIHPRSRKMLNELSINVSGIRFMNPFDYLSFLHLESRAKVILTDSGGIQEEACILGVPCVTLRDTTERPETLEVGANVLAGTSSVEIVEKVRSMLNKKYDWKHPFGDGKAATRIINELNNRFN
ncbi:UDP-N-acetylglucosamine 2-epimerase (non-hydrolyzing), partial [Candidatus Bathyarchaeota archaeon]|nr:UDP-N-acetylglucosamine 2-epimerase (non-hydrolyzing) [Candidatus Bathyarchaeota archaeon]